MSNRLANESSPYLLQHQDNPVDWHPWGEDALERAQSEGKPIFLSIGYAACHWCHVMEHESFEDPETAALMNDLFINIKVDREERPDLDTIYMNAVVAMTGQGGWPMSVFLTPSLEPFYGGTYFPPERRYNMPSFREVLISVSNAWLEDRERVSEIGDRLKARLKQELSGALGSGQNPIDPETLERASMSLAQSYDWKSGGWGQAPKFPQPMTIEFLIRRVVRGDKMAGTIVEHALNSMAQGGMYDIVGGGFHRYSVDDVWLVPHFEKMLYDNALLSRAYLHAYLISGDEKFRAICTETIDFVVREMTHELGGHYSSLDADSEGEEGIFYVWSIDELRELIHDPEEFRLIEDLFEINETGNFEGRIILRFRQENKSSPTLELDSYNEKLADIKKRLLEARGLRVRPSTDDKVLTAWNGLMLASIAEAARYFDRDDYKDVAMRNADFLLSNLIVDGRLKRAWRAGSAKVNGFLDDYAALILGLVSLYQTDPDPRWYASAVSLADEMIDGFRNISGGFFDTRDNLGELLIRPRDIQDNATPSGNSLACSALLSLAALAGNSRYRSLGEGPLGTLAPVAEKYPTAFGQWLAALDMAVGPMVEVAIIGPHERPETQALKAALWSTYSPNLVSARSDLPLAPKGPELLVDRTLINDLPTAYVCEGFACKLPVNSPDDLISQLNEYQTSGTQATEE